MADVNDWNTKIITEFRANQGRVGGPFQGAPLTLVHHRGRKSGPIHPALLPPPEEDPAVSTVSPVMPVPPGEVGSSEDDWRSHHPRPRVASRLTN